MIYRDLLFDLDHTLLDFNAAEDVALTELLTEAHVDDIETYKEVYSSFDWGVCRRYVGILCS